MILLQVITVLFSIALAWLNKWPVVKFRESGLSIRGEKDFHAANAVVKVFYTASVLWVKFFPTISLVIILCCLIVMLIQWFVFDIALNVFTGKPAFYLGQTAWLDKLVKNGKLKAAVVLLLIIILNFVLWRYR